MGPMPVPKGAQATPGRPMGPSSDSRVSTTASVTTASIARWIPATTILRRCQFILDDSRCQNGVYCDGVERCDPDLGCRRGSILDCNDDQTCTIDTCVEATRTCKHDLRDADDDGSPDGHCTVGGDCDDGDPTVNPKHVEVCGNGKDDNCDGKVDETTCQKPTHDTCLDPLLVAKTGIYELDTTAAAFDYPGTCAPMGAATRKDVVAALQLTGAPVDADIVAEAPGGTVAVGIGEECGVLASEIACGKGVLGKAGNQFARVRARSLPAGNYPVYVWVDRDEKVLLHVTLGPPTAPPTNETCGTAQPIALATPVIVSLVGTTKDLASRCGFEVGDLGLPVRSTRSVGRHGVRRVARRLRRSGRLDPPRSVLCAGGRDRLRVRGGRAELRARAPQGEILRGGLRRWPHRRAARGERRAPGASSGRRDLQRRAGARSQQDARYFAGRSHRRHRLRLRAQRRGRCRLRARARVGIRTCCSWNASRGRHRGAVSLALPSVRGGLVDKVCAKGGSLARSRLAARRTRGIVPRRRRDDVGNCPSSSRRSCAAAVPPTLVPFADTCATATAIPETGGFFQGNTANASADYSAGCDVTGVLRRRRRPDAEARAEPEEARRVRHEGSSYATLLDVRKGETCPGREMPGACSAGYLALRSFVDHVHAGVYWVQVDGYAGDEGTWFLDVHVVDP